MSENRVALLDETTANQIAAGEVVERPASAVKELLENALDAGATLVSIGLEEGGKERILIQDNGSGMTRQDAILSLQRHATSKIRSADDLFAIHTLGFRGEALPSIASISQFTLTTRTEEEAIGTILRVQGGDLESVEETAATAGTVIEVRSLFYNTPARLKFLKSSSAEMARIMEVAGQLAIAHPHVSIRLHNGKHETFASPGTGDRLNTLASVWGRELAKHLIPIQNGSKGLEVTGYIATPDVSRPGRSHELIFVNGRPIRNRLIGHALEDAFRSLTPDSRFPIAALFVEINPELVDVNVHPTKTEVKFTRDGEVHHAVSQAIKQALLDYGIVPKIHASGYDPTAVAASPMVTPTAGPEQTRFEAMIKGFAPVEGPSGWLESTDAAPSVTPAVSAAIENIFHQSPLRPPVVDPFALDDPQEPAAAAVPTYSEDLGPSVPADPSEPLQEPQRPRPFTEQLREFRVLGQAKNTYIIALTPQGIAVIDQHVAHERVLYERLTIKRLSDGIPVQRLVVPLTITPGRREALLLGEHCDSFRAAGWDIEPFGKESFMVRSVPAYLAHKPYEQVLKDMVDELTNLSVSRRLLVQKDHVTITNACKMAVKAGDPLSIPEMEGLLEQLAETENPYLCPHGRPIVVTISFQELDKLFKRA